MTLHEIRVSEIQPGDEWLLEGAWVLVTAVEFTHPDDRVTVDYVQDSEPGWDSQYRGFEVAVVKRDEPARPREWHDHDCGGSYGDKPHWHYT
jgi:hypothetical protein